MHRKNALCQINSNRYDCLIFPSGKNKLMNRFASPLWRFMADNRNPYESRLTWGEEIHFIR